MIVALNGVSSMDAEMIQMKADDPAISTVRPRRYAKSQRKVHLYPFSVHSDDGSEIVDQGYITIDARTGQLSIEHQLKEVPFELETGGMIDEQ